MILEGDARECAELLRIHAHTQSCVVPWHVRRGAAAEMRRVGPPCSHEWAIAKAAGKVRGELEGAALDLDKSATVLGTNSRMDGVHVRYWYEGEGHPNDGPILHIVGDLHRMHTVQMRR
jgi:hypothetical protein